MKKRIIFYSLSILVIIFLCRFNVNDFLIDMNIRKKCGDEYIGIENKVLKNAFLVRSENPDYSIRDSIRQYVVGAELWKKSEDIGRYLVDNGFYCDGSHDLHCVLKEEFYAIQHRSCKTEKYLDRNVYKYVAEIEIYISEVDLKNIRVKYDLLQIKY